MDVLLIICLIVNVVNVVVGAVNRNLEAVCGWLVASVWVLFVMFERGV